VCDALLMARRWLFGSVLVLIGCSNSDPPERERRAYADEGSVCVEPGADGKLSVTVVFPTCLSGSCDRVVATSCSVARSATEITITSKGETESTGARECTSDCGSLVARCDATGIPPGSYRLVHGTASATLSVPGMPVKFGDTAPFDACSL
jgi:hypothetical protein